MADTAGSCDTCTNSFNEVDRRHIVLPCGHDFCLTCLVRQKTSGDHKCAKCQGDWETIELPALVAKKRVRVEAREEALCKKHDYPIIYWCNSRKELYCKKCVTEQEVYVKLELVEDAVPLMKADIVEKADAIVDLVDGGVPSLEEEQLQLKECLLGVQEFMKDLQKLEKDLHERFARLESHKAEKLDVKTRAQEIRAITANVEAGTDVAVVLESRAEVEGLAQLDCSPSMWHDHSLCNIVSSYLDVKQPEGRCGSYSFLSKFIEASGMSLPALRDALTFAESLEDGAEWCAVDERSYFGVLLALSDAKRKPSCLMFQKQWGAYCNFPVNVVAEAARIGKDCEFKAEFLNSFLHMEDTVLDQERLESLLSNSSLRLVTFVGHLDPASIAKLPPTIRTLGLAIKTAAEAEAVSSLRPWELLDTLHVCVGEDISVDDLRPLPSVHTKILHFNFKDVDRMRPVLDALIPPQQEQYGCVQLHLRTSEVGIEEAPRLAQQFRGSPINKGILIESCAGELTEMQRQKLVTAFRDAAAGGITFESCAGGLAETQRQKLLTTFRVAAAGGLTIASCAGELTETQRQRLARTFRKALARGIASESCARELTVAQKETLNRAFWNALAGGTTFGSCAGELSVTQRQKLFKEFTEAGARDIAWTLTKYSNPSTSLERFFN